MYSFQEVIKAFNHLCYDVMKHDECEGECPLYKEFGDDCCTIHAMDDPEKWAQIVMDYKEVDSLLNL